MLNYLTESELEVATNLISGGLKMAKTSMEQILQSPIDLKRIDYGSGERAIPNSKKGDRFHLVKTELRGQLTGSCFLIFSEEEVNKINAACLPEEIISTDSEESRMMKMAFLKEIDNMVAAAVVTEFSNILELELFGDVPHAYVLNADEVSDYLSKESAIYQTIVHFKANFQGTEMDISPDFIWMFSDQFVDKIKDIV